MKWAYQVKDKTKVVAVLLLIIVLILVNNISNRKTLSKLNESIASIYKDRLMPATYIFQLTDHLYQKQLLQNAEDKHSSGNAANHDSAVAAIIKTYESTYLTKAEKNQWMIFKKELEQYNILTAGTVNNDEIIHESFNNVLKSLNALSEIQASEGNHILHVSKLDISGTIIMSQLEIALLLILGILALVLMSVNDNKLMHIQNPRLN